MAKREIIPDEEYLKYGVKKEDIDDLYEKFKLYNKIVQSHRKSTAKADEDKFNEKYHCKLCDKDVRLQIKYHHLRTQKHCRLKEEFDKNN